MSIINETKKYLHMLVKILVFILILCAFKLVESFFEVRRMPEVYVVSYLVFAYFILARLFSERKDKKRKFLIFLIPCYFLFIKLIFAMTYIYLHIDEYNIFSLWYL